MRTILLTLSIFLIIFSTCFGQADSVSSKPGLRLDFPLIDLPYMTFAAKTNANYSPENPNVSVGFNNYLKGLTNPSMSQSLAWSKNYYSTGHYLIQKAFGKKSKNSFLNKVLSGVSIIGFDLLSSNSPFGSTWVHEEFHRASMTVDYTNSYNSVYDFEYILNPLDAPTVAKVTDEDLSNFKKRNPINFIRIKSSGIEAETLLPMTLQNDNFYNNLNLHNSFSYLLHYANGLVYLASSANYEGNPALELANDLKERDVAKRDFTGIDFYGWIYDMNRPNQPYNDRGVHPSGVGINRYIQIKNLQKEEIDYLKKMGKRQFLNLISPMNFFVSSIKINQKLRFNFGFQHFLTSFGDDTGFRVLLNHNKYNWYFAYHHFQNKTHTFPTLEGQLIDLPLKIQQKSIALTTQAIMGLQPYQQSYDTSKSSFLGYININATYNSSKKLLPYMAFSYKTKGWVAGNPFLNQNTSLNLGLKVNFAH